MNAGEASISLDAAKSPKIPGDRFRRALAPHAAHACRQIGKSPRFGDRDPNEPNRLDGQNPGQDEDGQSVETLLNRSSRAGEGVKARISPHQPLDHRGEQRLLIGKPGVDRGFAGRGRLGDLVDARALETALEKDAARRVEDPFLDPARERARGPTGTHRAASAFALLGDPRPFHRCFAFHRFHKPATAGFGALDLGATVTKVNGTEQFRFEGVKGRVFGSSGHGAQESGPRRENV